MTGREPAARLIAAVEHIAVTGADDRALRARLLDVIEGFVPFDAYAFLLTDPMTTVGCSPVADGPDLAALPDLIRLKYLTPLNRWTRLPANGCATLQEATSGRLDESLLWREHLAGLGILDVVSVVFKDRFGWWGFLDLWRRESHFTDSEVAALADVRPAITSRLRRVQAAAFAATEAPPGYRGPGALILSPALTIRPQTAQTHDWLTALVPPEGGRGPRAGQRLQRGGSASCYGSGRGCSSATDPCAPRRGHVAHPPGRPSRRLRPGRSSRHSGDHGGKLSGGTP